ncbi:AI-2E family transporter [Oxalobacteraceae bacterium R-40]|uniref:AI-2E family transporter n=1 Tax=Keguizhuia sedimenti TaxID=3064264 RepID=A0ABU1BJW7_9BURK|nr:AI-2E family transporter [Oxalobacteraceae bacterium R-40]
MSTQNKTDYPVIASYILAACALFLVLHRGLLAALFSGLLVYSLVQIAAPRLGKKFSDQRAKLIAVALLSTLIVLFFSAAIWAALSFFQSEAGSMPVLLKKMADIIEASRDQIPEWLKEYLPSNAEALREKMALWLRAHAEDAKVLGQEAGRTIAHLIIGMVIGAMAALHDTTSKHRYLPLAAALHQRVVGLTRAFQSIVFAQVRIAAINAVFTGIFLLVALPMAGVHLPLSKTMVLITFIAGMLPVLGNIISNTVIVVIALSHSLQVALMALAFLIAIHKLEYFLNAKIIGAHINARVWELLAAMLTMETLFGIPGVVAAPVFYAYVKQELADRGLV